jgi:hypothetical protein
MFECIDEVQRSLSGGIGRRGFGHGALMRKKFDGFGDAFSSSFGDVDAVTAIMLRGHTDVPAVDTMWIPGASIGWSFMHKHLAARRCKRGAIVIKQTIELRVRQELGVDARRSQQVECCCRLFGQPTPKVHWKIGMHTGETRDEVAFLDVDGFFRSIGAVHVGRC